MKTLRLLIGCLVCPAMLMGQVKEVISSSGDVHMINNVIVEWTLGEAFINDNVSAQNALQEGFLASSEESFSFGLLADLGVEAIINEQSAVYFPGELIDLTVDVSNGGDIDATGSIGTLYLSRDSIVDNGDIEVGFYVIDEIGYQENISIARQLELPLSLESGLYYIIAQVDVFDNIIEYDESNNLGYISFTVENISSAPDLSIDTLHISPQIFLRDSTQLSLIINNGGKTGSGGSEVVFYLSRDVEIDDSDFYIDYDPIGSIAALSSDELSRTIVIEDSTLIGEHYLIAFVDGFDKIIESEETNNKIAIPISIAAQDQTTSTIELDAAYTFNISPNPATSVINITGEDNLNDFAYKIYDQKGILVLDGDSLSNEISIDSLKLGMYFVTVYGLHGAIIRTPFIKATY